MERSRIRVLLVEDSPSDARLIQHELGQVEGHRLDLTLVSTLAAALAKLHEQSFAVALVDLGLPDSTGFATFTRIQAECPELPIVVLTGVQDEALGDEAIRRGVQDYLVKGGADSKAMARSLRYAIERRRSEEHLTRALKEAEEGRRLLERAQDALTEARNDLERRVDERTAELAQTVEALHAEVVRRRLAEEVLVRRTSQLRALASELTLAEQRERQRLALLLHDGLQQLLVGAKYRLELLDQAKDKSLRRSVKEVSELISESITACRSLTAELSPAILRAGGLVPALEWLVRWSNETHGIDIELSPHGAVGATTEDVSVLLFQAVRELLFNVVKHAGVRSARVEVSEHGRELMVVVADSGVGFDPAQLRSRGGQVGGYGLFSIQERLSLMGGRLEIESAPGRGSKLTLFAPLDSSRATTTVMSTELPARAHARGAVPRRPSGHGAQERIRVMLVDDHVVMRQGVAHLLRGEPDMEVVAEASDAESAVAAAHALLPDVILMDINMPGQSGVVATAKIHAELPDVCIIGLSMLDAEEAAQAMCRAGAVAYCAKTAPPASLIATIRQHAANRQGVGNSAPSRRGRRGRSEVG